MKRPEQLMLSIGALLASEREKRGIPVEKAAKETRMRPQRIRDMEGDDLSYFTNPSYARMFIIAYAKYLGIPMHTILEHLPDRGEPGSEGYQYINAAPDELPSLRRDLVSRPNTPSMLVPILITAALVVIAGAGALGTYLYVNVDRITRAVDKPPTPEPTPQVVTNTIVLEAPGLTNLPNHPAPAEPAARGPIDPTVPPPAPAAPANFTAEAEIATPPRPTPTVIIGEAPPVGGQTLQTLVPATTPADDDRAFLLSAPTETPSAQ